MSLCMMPLLGYPVPFLVHPGLLLGCFAVAMAFVLLAAWLPAARAAAGSADRPAIRVTNCRWGDWLGDPRFSLIARPFLPVKLPKSGDLQCNLGFHMTFIEEFAP